MELKDFKKGCEQWTRDELLESLYKITKENKRLNNQYDLMENSLEEKQEVIDKAIEYIEIIQYNESYGVKEKDYLKLLDILKGEDNE